MRRSHLLAGSESIGIGAAQSARLGSRRQLLTRGGMDEYPPNESG